MSWELITPQFIATVGFPIAVASYLLVRQEKTIRELTTAVQQLTLYISKLKL